MKQTIIEKLTSRKLWAAIAAFVATILVAIFENELPPEGAELIKNGVIALCVYIFGEAGVDIARMIWQAKDTVVSDNMSDAQESQMSGNSEVSVIEPETTVSATVAKDTPREAETKSGAAAEGEEDEEDELSCSEIVE